MTGEPTPVVDVGRFMSNVRDALENGYDRVCAHCGIGTAGDDMDIHEREMPRVRQGDGAMTCYGIAEAHDGTDVRRYRLMGRAEEIELCGPCASEAMARTVLDRRADPERPDRGSRWNIGPLGRRLLGLAR